MRRRAEAYYYKYFTIYSKPLLVKQTILPSRFFLMMMMMMMMIVESGTYRTNEEIGKMLRDRAEASGLSAVDINDPEFEQDDSQGTHDLHAVMRRFRQDIHRGSAVVDYPKEYLILRQHPPFPEPPRTPAKMLRRLQRQHSEQEQAGMKELVQHYLHRQKPQQ
jgi:hypothetical protein